MKLKKINIDNYRNLSGISIVFHPINNFILGDNNIGKTNFLELLNIIFNFNNFKDTDFNDITKPITIDLTINLDDVEKGLFDDLFDPENSNEISISVIQETVEDTLCFKHVATNTIIPNNTVKCVNFISYDSLRTPSNELNFDKNKGVGKFLNHLIIKYLEIENIADIDFIYGDKITNLLGYINGNLKKIKSFDDYSIEAGMDSSTKNVLSKLVTLTDENKFSFSNAGCGVQFLSLITLSILERILNMSKARLEKSIMQDEDGKNCFPIILGMDEPEIHLHPYMQRSLVKYILNVINNNETNFSQLLKGMFNIDKFIGQAIISTHSPNILLNDYKHVIRFYKNSEKNLVVKSGTQLNIPQHIEKHLLAHMPYIKEAFFSKSIIIVEGDSEYGCLPQFSSKLGIDIDECSIGIIKADGAKTIPPLMKLFNEFGISSIGIVDKDEYNTSNIDPNYLCTDKTNFEEDIVDILITNNDLDTLKSILEEYDNLGLNRILQKDSLNKTISKYNLPVAEFTGNMKFADVATDDLAMLKVMYLTWLNINKNCVLGRIIGATISPVNIPPIYKAAIEKAKELQQNG